MGPVIQAYGSLALENNSEVGEALLGICSLYLHQCLLAPSKRCRPTGCNGSFLGGDLVISPTCEVGFAGSVLGRINCEKAWNGHGIPLHGFLAQLKCPRAKLSALKPIKCRELGLLVQSGK